MCANQLQVEECRAILRFQLQRAFETRLGSIELSALIQPQRFLKCGAPAPGFFFLVPCPDQLMHLDHPAKPF